MVNAHVQETTDSNFQKDVLQSDKPVLVDFWAVWCGPCRALSPTIDEIATDNAGKIKVVKVNTDDNPNVPSQYGVRGIPALFLFKNGQVVDQTVGVQPKANIQAMINKAL